MGRSSRRFTSVNIISHDSKIQKYQKYKSVSSLNEALTKKQKRIRDNFKHMIRRLMAKGVPNKQNYLISFLNIVASCEDICSLACVPGIPSIQNMISQHYINNPDEIQNSQFPSNLSITYPLSSELLTCQPQIPIYFVCLLDKILKLINCPLTKKQNQSVVKGTWNILIKYWKDYGHQLYEVNQKVQWGLLQLVNFKFGANKKERFQAQQRLRKGLEEVENTQQVQQRSYFCTLQHIQ